MKHYKWSIVPFFCGGGKENVAKAFAYYESCGRCKKIK